MRADRLLSILLLLQTHQRMTARELSKRLEVSERTIHRDMEALSAAGVPVVAERGTGGGWGLLGTYQTTLTGLTETEAHALFLTQPARLLTDLGLHKASETALIKLFASLPAIHRQNAEYVRQRIHIDGAGWNTSEERVPLLPILQDAIWQERKLHFTYQRGDDTRVERLVNPLGLVAKGSTWYLIASVDDRTLTYRVSRIQCAFITDEPCIRPPQFDLAAYWEQSAIDFKANLPRYSAVVRVSPDILTYMRYVGRYARIEHTDPPDEDGRTRVTMCFEGEHNACEYVLSFGPRMEVLEPLALREMVIQEAEHIIQFYAQLATR